VLKILSRRYEQYQMASKKPTVDPTVSSSDTIVDPAVAVYIQFIDYEEEW